MTNNCHLTSARAKGLTDAQFAELMAVIGLANETNRLANGCQAEVDPAFEDGGRKFRAEFSECYGAPTDDCSYPAWTPMAWMLMISKGQSACHASATPYGK